MIEEHSQEVGGGTTCALPGPGLADRMEAWRALALHALSRDVEPGRVAGAYPREMREAVESLVAAESQCCPFLSFDVRERGAVVELELRYPPEFEPMVSAITGEVAGSRASAP